MDRTDLVRQTYKLERVSHRLQRSYASLPAQRMKSELAYHADRESFESKLPPASADDGLVEALARDSIVVTDIASLGAGDMVKAATELADELREASPRYPDQPALHLSPERLSSRPEIYQWGAGDRILNIAERYMRVPAAYHGVYLRRDRAIPATAASNEWHLDMEDRHMFKVIIYLTDVDNGDGAFEYIPRSHSMEIGRALGPNFKLGGDERMAHLVPRDEWQAATGPAGTVVLADTAVLFHRGRRPSSRDRITLFYDYTSRRPWQPYYCKAALPQATMAALTAGMGPRVHDAVFWRPRLNEFDPIKHE